MTIVTFRCGAYRCAFDRLAVAEILPLPEMMSPPGMPNILEGFVNLAGEALPIVDAARLFGVERDEAIDPIYRHILVLGKDEERIGLIVDRADDVRRIESSRIVPSDPDQSLNGCISGQIELDGARSHILAADRVLLSAERARLAELREAEQSRLDALAVQ